VLAVDVQTNMEEVAEFLNKNKNPLISGVQVMGIENIGFQGQGFAEKSLEIVKKLKKEFPNLKIYFDGGINEETIGEIKNAGVDIFCVGSFLTKSDNFEEDLDFLQQEIFS
jgi:pentose-5-phosphate-3-epimerase